MSSDTRAQCVFLIRHGETEWAIAHRHTGRTDIPLTETGRRQARQLAAYLRPDQFSLVLTSPLSRAAETCRLAGLGDHAVLTDDLAEWDYGDYEGRTTADIRAERPGWLLWNDGVPNGEMPDDVGRRVDRVIETVRATDGDVALVAHGHLLRVLAARWLGLPPARGVHLKLDTATVSILGWERETPAIALWNDPSPLRPT